MFKEYLVLLSRDPSRNVECADYVINRHAQAVLRHRAFRGVFRRYIVSRAVPSGTLSIPDLLYAHRPEVPMIVEHVCDHGDLFRNALHDEDHQETIKPDEEYIAREFLGAPPIAVEMDERVIFGEGYTGRYRVFDFLKRHPGIEPASFSAWLDQEGELLARSSEFRSVVPRRVHNYVRGGTALYAESGGTGASTGRDFDAIVETWVPSLGELPALYREMRHRYVDQVDPASSFSVVTTEHVLITDQS